MYLREAVEQDMAVVRALFIEYQTWLGSDLCFQGFADELATLPGNYAPPRGAIFLADEDNVVVGCVAIRPKSPHEAELKRLYVRPDQQGKGIGRTLFTAAMHKAEVMGYNSVVLDTLPSMTTAKSLYLSYGFEPIPANYANPTEGAEYYRYLFN